MIRMEDIQQMLEVRETYLKNFKKDMYEEMFCRFSKENAWLIEETTSSIQSGLAAVYAKELSESLITAVSALLENASGKRKREDLQLRLNLYMAVYVLPTILNCKPEQKEANDIAQVVCLAWGQAFALSNIKASTKDKIQEGFRSKLCYITSAICEHQGKPADCYELTVLKNYRDSYLCGLAEGESLIREYYDIAPTIVKRINKSKNSAKIYSGLWNDYLKPCITLIEEGKNEECRLFYTKMVTELKTKYMEG